MKSVKGVYSSFVIESGSACQLCPLWGKKQ